jgi:ammonia channel protein AmtB
LTALAGSVGALTASVVGGVLEARDTGAAFKVSIKWGNNGVLAALVASSSGCATSEPVGMFFTAATSATAYVFAARFVKDRLAVDDVVDAAAVHGVGGLVGLLAAPLFATPQHYQHTYLHASDARAAQCAGVFYGGDGSGLAANLVFALALVGWATVFTGGVFFLLHRQLILRNDVQLGANLDDSQHNNHFLQEIDRETNKSASNSPGRPRGRSPRQGMISMTSVTNPASFSLGAAANNELKAEQSLREVSKSPSNSPPGSGKSSFSEKPPGTTLDTVFR